MRIVDWFRNQKRLMADLELAAEDIAHYRKARDKALAKHYKQQLHLDRMAREMATLKSVNVQLAATVKGHREDLRIRDEAISVLELQLDKTLLAVA